MIYEVRAKFLFDKPDEARDFYHDCEVAFPKTTSVNPSQENTEFSAAELIENHHDEAPTAPCHIILQVTNQPPPPEPI